MKYYFINYWIETTHFNSGPAENQTTERTEFISFVTKRHPFKHYFDMKEKSRFIFEESEKTISPKSVRYIMTSFNEISRDEFDLYNDLKLKSALQD